MGGQWKHGLKPGLEPETSTTGVDPEDLSGGPLTKGAKVHWEGQEVTIIKEKDEDDEITIEFTKIGILDADGYRWGHSKRARLATCKPKTVHVYIGKAGAKVGLSYYDAIMKEHGISAETGKALDYGPLGNLSHSFIEVSSGQYVPNVIFVGDMPTDADSPPIFEPCGETLVARKSSADKDTFSAGYNDEEGMNGLKEAFRKQMEKLTAPIDVVVVSDFCGVDGGFALRSVKELEEMIGSCFMTIHNISSATKEQATSCYDQLLACSRLYDLETRHAVILYDVSLLTEQAKTLGNGVEWHHLAAKSMANLSSPYRFNVDPAITSAYHCMEHLVVLPRLCWLVPSLNIKLFKADVEEAKQVRVVGVLPGRVQMCTVRGESEVDAAHKRFQDKKGNPKPNKDDPRAMSDAKVEAAKKYSEKEATAVETYEDKTFKCKFDDGQEFIFPFEIVAKQVTTTEDGLKAAFKKFDTSGDGVITKDELVAILTRKVNGKSAFSEQDAEEVFDAADTNGDGQMEYGEFVSAWTVISGDEKMPKKTDKNEKPRSLPPLMTVADAMESVFNDENALVRSKSVQTLCYTAIFRGSYEAWEIQQREEGLECTTTSPGLRDLPSLFAPQFHLVEDGGGALDVTLLRNCTAVVDFFKLLIEGTTKCIKERGDVVNKLESDDDYDARKEAIRNLQEGIAEYKLEMRVKTPD